MKKTKLINVLEENYVGANKNWQSKNLKKFIKNNKDIENELIRYTNFCPQNTSWYIRFDFLIKDIKSYPVCENCSINPVSFNVQTNKLRKYCGKRCASSSKEVREKVKKTFIKNFGVEHPMLLPETIIKNKKKFILKYGVDNPSKSNEIKEKKEKIFLEKWGHRNISSNPEIKAKKRKTCLKNYGTEYPSQNRLIFDKQQKTSSKVFYYKDTNIKYQGKYELYFLERMDEINLINEISNGQTIKYIYENKKRTYHIDFKYKNISIEIKSSWTYNKNGKDKILENKNKTKWEFAKNNKINLKILFSKKDIDNFINTLLKYKNKVEK